MNFTTFALIVAVFAIGLAVVGCPKKEEVAEKETLEKVVNDCLPKGFDAIKDTIKDNTIIVFDGKALKLFKDEAAAKVDFPKLAEMTKTETKEGKVIVYSPKKEEKKTEEETK